MYIVLLITNDKNFQKIKNNKSMLDLCFSKYKKINEIDYFLICVDNDKYHKIKTLNNEKIKFFPSFSDKNMTIVKTIMEFAKEHKINDDDKIIIHEVNFANTELRIIKDAINKSLTYNFINTILPFDNTFEIIMKNGSQFLIKNQKEVYHIQSPQLLHYCIFKNIYLDQPEITPIKMINVLGSKYNYDLSDELMLKLFISEND